MNLRSLVPGLVALGVSAGCTVYARPPHPHVHVLAGPRLVVIAGSDIRYCAECDEDVFFYSDFWWVYRSGGWYRCASWGEPWVVVETGRLPAAFIRVPPGQFKRRWHPHHPAHDHHPDLDTWKPDREPDREPPAVGGTVVPADQPGTVGTDKPGKDKDKKDPKDGKGKRGRGRGRR